MTAAFSAALAWRNDGDGAATLPPDLRQRRGGGDAWQRPRRRPRRVTTTPATIPPATRLAGDLDGLFPVATRSSRRQATATMIAMPGRPTGRVCTYIDNQPLYFY